MCACTKMHPRNLYKHNPPDFAQLAKDYPHFAKHCYSKGNGKTMLDFQDPASIRALTCVLLERDFNLKVDIPPDCLVPRVPGRLNYILWIEDILKENKWVNTNTGSIKGMDIGTGASCIYPLLGARQCGWSFVATDKDNVAVKYALQNVQQNSFSHLIEILKVDAEDFIEGAVSKLDNDSRVDFLMCNPPYYGDAFCDDNGVIQVTTGRPGRAAPHSVTVAQPVQAITGGGEEAFVSRLIEDSKKLGNKIRFYTSLLGRKSTLQPCIKRLKEANVASFTDTVFYQGRTNRWGLAWTFDQSISFQRPTSETESESKKQQQKMKRGCIQIDVNAHLLPPAVQENVKLWLTEIFNQLNIDILDEADNHLRCVATEDTWSKQRMRKRKGDSGSVHEINTKFTKLDSGMVCVDEERQTLLEFVIDLFPLSPSSNDVSIRAKAIGGVGGKGALHQVLQYIANKLPNRPSPLCVNA